MGTHTDQHAFGLRHDEEYVRHLLNLELASTFANVVWSPERDDPPDVWVALDGTLFAVEITSIDTEVASGVNSTKQCALHNKVVVPVVDEVNESMTFEGRWMVSASVVKAVRQDRAELSEWLRRFFESEYTTTHNKSFTSSNGFRATVTRYGDGKGVLYDGLRSSGGFGVDLDVQLKQKLKHVVLSKDEKLKQNKRYGRRILAVTDRFVWRRDRWPELLPAAASRFDLIYRVTGNQAHLVYDRDSFTVTA